MKKAKNTPYIEYAFTYLITLVGVLNIPNFPHTQLSHYAVAALISAVAFIPIYMMFRALGGSIVAVFLAAISIMKEFFNLKYWYLYLIAFAVLIWLLSFPFSADEVPDIEAEFYRY